MKPEQNSPCPCGSGKKYKRCCGATHGSLPRPVEPASPATSIPVSIESALGFHRTGRLDKAEEIYRSILQTSPRNADALHLLGVLLHQTGKNQAAVDLIEKAIKARPNVPEYYNNCGEAYRALSQFDQAGQRYKRALALKPNYAEAHNNLSLVLMEQEKYDEAKPHVARALAIKPDYAEAHLNMCTLLTHSGQIDQALPHCKRALDLQPNFAEANDTMGHALASLCKFSEALSYYDQALRLNPNFPKAHWNRSHTLLSLGDIAQGWQEYDWRWKLNDFIASPNKFNFPQPWWDGSDLHGKTILVWGEQGIGDEILFANLIPDVIAAAGHCVIECEPRLAPLFARSFPQAEVIARANPPHPRALAADVACQSPAGSLPRWLRTSLDSFPDHHGYLKADPQRVAFWQERLASLGTNIKVGICWRSMLRNRSRDVQYTELSQWGPILSVPGISFVNLQYDNCGEELAAAKHQFGVEIHAWDDIDLLNDLDDAAALTSALDLVISPATSVAAMAGALGIPVWQFASYSDWANLGTGHMPWFPSMRLFQRAWDTPWDTIIDAAAEELARLDKDSLAEKGNRSGLMERKENRATPANPSLALRDIPQAIQTAIEFHQAGQLPQAETIYRQVLQFQPDNTDALHLLGLIAHHAGHSELALDLIGKAIALNPNVALFHNNYGEACRALGRFDEAIAHYGQALALDPNSSEAHINMGNALQDRGQWAEAIAHYGKALALNPNFAVAHNNLGSALHEQGRLDEAIACCMKAIALEPNYADAHYNLGNMLKDGGRLEEAVAHFEKCIALKPAYAEAHFNLGNAYRALKRLDEAASCYVRALELNPRYPEAHLNLGTIFYEQDNPDQAISHYEEALALNPRYAEAHLNLGVILKDLERLDDAISHYETALAINPDLAEAYYNLGIALHAQGKIDQAIACQQNALCIRHDYPDALFSLSEELLASGDLDQGWEIHEARWTRTGASPKRDFPQPWWDGADLHGKTILVWEEQGIGDEMFFASLIPDVIAAAGHCILECAPRLVPLFARSFPQAEVVARANPPHPRELAADVACQIPAGSLPRWLRPSIDSFPDHHGYLQANPQRVAFWQQRLASLGTNLKVGICWRSMLKNRFRDVHYSELSQWGAILSVPGVFFINLQYDNCAEELAAARRQFGVEIHAWDDIDLLNDLDEAAALTAALDLVISAPTSVSAMAGALGIPVWQFAIGETWDHLGTDHMPWFPSMRLFQRAWNTPWESVIGVVAQELAKLGSPGQPALPAPSSEKKHNEIHSLISQALQAAIEFHQAGQLKEAEALYNEILRLQPGNADALHLLGVIAHQVGKNDIAVSLIAEAIKLSPGIASFHNDCGEAYRVQGKLDEAIAHYERALALDPGFPEPHNNLGNALQDRGQLESAIAHYEKALALKPDFAAARNNLASAFHAAGRMDEAIASCNKALALDPNYAEAHYNLGNILKDQEQLDQAIDHLEKALALNPQYAEAHLNLGVALREQGRLQEMGRWDEAIAHLEKAIALRPDFAEAYVNLGVALKNQGKPDQAIACHQHALRIRPGYPDAMWFLGIALLSSGDLAQGWEKYEARWIKSGAGPKRDFPQPWWNGSDLHGKTILVWEEQGIGDELFFAGLIPDVIAAAGHCVLECEPRLAPLFARSFPQAEVVARTDPPHPRALAADVAYQIPAGSLPKWLRPSLDSFPDLHGYLKANPQRVAFWQARLAGLGPNIKVGICWRSMGRNKHRNAHYTELSQWRAILSVPGVSFVNLQYDNCAEELTAARQQFGVEIHAWDDIDLLNDLDDAAALTASLDLVISPATAVAAMAGALGIPVWQFTLDDDWSALGTDRIPWFPSMRLFRRAWDTPWDAVIEAAARELANPNKNTVGTDEEKTA